MVTFSGKLTKDPNGMLCMKLEKFAKTPGLENIPLEELVEEFCEKDVILEIDALESSKTIHPITANASNAKPAKKGGKK